MIFEFLWQQALVFGMGFGLARAQRFVRTRMLHRRLMSFFGADVVSIVVQALRPLSLSFFDKTAEKTIALKVVPSGGSERLPIYGDVLHLDDYRASQEVVELLRQNGGNVDQLLADSDVLGEWATHRNVVCIGSPFVNAALAEVIAVETRPEGPLVTAVRPSDTLDSYRVEIRAPSPVVVGVDADHAVGVIARLRNPADPRGWIVGVWGCRAESTYAAARHLRSAFRTMLPWARQGEPFVVLLAVRGGTFGIVDPMYAISGNTVVLERPDLLQRYDRTNA